MSAHNMDEAIRETTQDYLDSLDTDNPPTPSEIQDQLLGLVATRFRVENAVREKNERWKIPHSLFPAQIALIIAKLYPVAKISCIGLSGSEDYDLLAIYQDSGPNEGIYLSNEKFINNIIREYCFTATRRDCEETIAILNDIAPRVTRCTERNLIAVNNGIFDYDTKQLMPFTRNKVFIAKSKVDYNPAAINPVIQEPDGTPWDVETWMVELFDDPELTQLAWEILGAIIRPNVPWYKSAWFYANTGNNGKGTLCELMRQLCGEGTYTSIPLADMGKDFALEPLTRATAIIVDENDVGTFVDKAANLKAIITNDVIQINRKFKTPIAYQFRGFMVQCLNEMPRIKDKSDSFYRRQLFVPFTKCFTGTEKKYIKNDFLHRKDVLEYVLYRVLNMNYYQLSEPEACLRTLEEYKEFNDPIRQFIDEMLPQCVWDLLPFPFLYDLYKAWFKKTSPNGSIQGRNTFIEDLVATIKDDDQWYCIKPSAKIRTGSRMDKPEYLIDKYNLEDWMNPMYKTSPNTQAKCSPFKNESYRGLLRR